MENRKRTKTAAGKDIPDVVTDIGINKPCAYNFEVGSDTEVGAEIIKLFRGGVKSEKNLKVSLVGEVGKRVQLLRYVINTHLWYSQLINAGQNNFCRRKYSHK